MSPDGSRSDEPRSRSPASCSHPARQGVELCYQTFGDPDDEPLLLVMGLGGPMTWWDPALCRLLAARGFYVIRYDNRDTGRSTKVPGRVSRTMLVRAFAGQRVRAPYSTARHGAATPFALLDHLGLESAHLVGVSMGGMIAQTMAIEQPAPGAVADQHHVDHRQALGGLAAPPPAAGADRRAAAAAATAYAEGSPAIWTMIGSPAYPLRQGRRCWPRPRRPSTAAGRPAACCGRWWP